MSVINGMHVCLLARSTTKGILGYGSSICKKKWNIRDLDLLLLAERTRKKRATLETALVCQ